MVYAFNITTLANVSEVSPTRTILKIEKGIITSFFVNFPPGSAGLLHLKVLREFSQIFPKTTGDFHGDDRYFAYRRLAYPVLFAPSELYAHTWNVDDTFAHSLDIHITVESAGVII